MHSAQMPTRPHALGRAYETDIAALDRDGYLRLPQLLSDHETRTLQSELEPWFGRTPRCQGDFYGWQTTRIGGLLSKAPIVQHLALNPRVLAIAETLLEPQCDCIQLNLTQATRVHPGERAQVPHRDEEMWPWPTGGRHWLINVMWAVSDFTSANGATRIWPASHRSGLDRSIDPAASVSVEMPAGSALVFLGSVTHGAGANETDAPRTGIIISYCLGWLKSYENQFLAYPIEVARLFPERLQRLIGYQMHRPNLGGCDGRDPIERLHGAGGIGPHIDAVSPETAEELRAYYHAAENAGARVGEGG
ncbi:MAG: phytanoyl-CoA dioxygenase family protein [Hyphomonadaceae bacterium]|nr:phytanoyl-CoA dioxygenase family protein [Hyphomonadaceae bacterium]